MACAFFNAATLENPSRMGHPKFKTKAGPSATLSSQSVKACFARRMAPPALGVILSEAKNLSVTVLSGWARLWGWVEFSGAALSPRRGCGFFLPCGTPRARRKDRSESASGKGRIEDRKIRIL
jgi:hypothetical protein